MDNKTFKRYRNVIFLEILSVLAGVVGLVIGILSLLALLIKKASVGTLMSNILTYTWTVIDCISIMFGICAIVYSSKTRKKDNKDENLNVINAAKRSSLFDGLSILLGLMGLIAAILSIVYNKNLLLNSTFSILTIIFDIGSVLFVVYSFHYLLTELWNGFKSVIKKTKNQEIIKARKIITKKLKKQIDEDYKSDLYNEIKKEIETEEFKKLQNQKISEWEKENKKIFTKKWIDEQKKVIEKNVKVEKLLGTMNDYGQTIKSNTDTLIDLDATKDYTINQNNENDTEKNKE